MAHLEHLYYFIAMTIFICCFFASEHHGYSRTLSVLVCVIPLLSLFCLLFFCIGASRIFTDVVRVSPCYSVAIIILFIVFASELHGYSRTLSVLVRAIPLLSSFCLFFLHRSFTDIHGRCPCYSVPFRCYDILFIVFASEHHGYSRTLSVSFRAIPLLSYFCLLFLHRSITDIHGRCPC